MIYLKNNTILQELYIPRQDYISNTTGSSGTYAEGYADGYESGYTSGSTDGFDSGYTEGYSSGETHQKGLLTSTGITENGEYQREDGWSAITVNVSGSVLEGKEIVISEDITVVTPDSGYGGFSAVTVDATEYGQENYDSGFDDGYTDGYSSGSSEGYDSGYTEGYQSGSTDGFNSGYTSGETHQKSLLVSTAITENGSYQRENGYSAITVNVPIPNIEANKEFTATTNGYYWVAPSSGSVTIKDRFDNDDDCYYITATTSGYPSIGRYNIFYIEDEFDSSKGQIDVYIDNGYLDYDDSLWEGGRIMDYETGDILRLKVYDANNGFGWMRDDDYNLKYDALTGLGVVVEVPQTGHTDQELQDAYDSGYTSGENNVISTFTATTATTNGIYGSSAHPLSSITVNVPQSGGSGVKYVEYIKTNNTQIGWDTGYNIGTDIDARIYLDFMPISGNGYGDYWFAYYGDDEDYVLFRRAGNNDPIGFMFGNNKSVKDGGSYSVTDGNRYLISLDKYGITDENTGTLLESVNSSYINSTNNLWLNCDGNPQVVSRCIPARYYGFRVENGNGETVLDMRPCLDGNDVPCFYDEVSQTYIYHQGSGTPVAGSVLPNPEYQSGYTDGYNEAISDVIDSAETLTVTANGSYSTALIADGHLWDEVIVNVSKGLSFVDYIHTTVLSASQRTAYIDTGIIPTTATTFRVQGKYKGYAQDGVIVGNTLYDNRDYRLFWAGSNSSPEIYYDFNEDRLGGYENHLYNGTVVDITCDNYSITFNGNVLGQSYTQYAVSYPQNILLDVGSWWAKSLEIWDDGVRVFDGKAAIDEDGNIGLYDSVSMSMVYNSGLTMAYEGTPISQDYASGYTDGQSSVISTFTAMTATTNGDYGSSSAPLSSITVNVAGYTQEELEQEYDKGYGNGYYDGENDVISTFTAITATTNGVYGSSASPLSSITVNVPQAHTGVTYVEYLETDGDEVYWNTNILLSLEPSGCVENRLVFMPLSASSQNNYYISDSYDGSDENRTFSIYANTVMTRASFSTYRNTMSNDITLNTKYDASVRYVSANTMEWTINGDTTQKTITSNEFQRGTVLINAVRQGNSLAYFAKARYYYLKLQSSEGVLAEFKPALDQNGVPCFYDEISQTYLYHSGSGNVTYQTSEYDSGYTSGYTDGYGDGFDDANNGFTCINGYDFSDPFDIETYSFNTATTAEAYFEFSFTPTNHYNSIWEDGNSEDSYGISQNSRGVNMFYYDLGCYVPINQEHFTSATSIFCIAEMLVNVANSSCTLNIFNVTDGYVASVSGTPYHFWNGFDINLCYFDDLADLPITFHKLKIYDGGVLVRNYKHTKDCNQWQIKDLVTGTKFTVGGIVG